MRNRWIVTGLFAGLVAVALLAGPLRAAAQSDYQPKPEELEKKRNAEALDARYRRALENSSQAAQQSVKTDPWANMRGPSDPNKKKK